MKGETNHDEAGPSIRRAMRRRVITAFWLNFQTWVGYAVIPLDTPQLAAGSFIGPPLTKTGKAEGTQKVLILLDLSGRI